MDQEAKLIIICCFDRQQTKNLDINECHIKPNVSSATSQCDLVFWNPIQS